MPQTVSARRRKLGVHISLDLETLERLDAEAAKLNLSRSELLRRVIEDWDEQLAEEKWVREQEEETLQEATEPWDKVKAELGL